MLSLTLATCLGATASACRFVEELSGGSAAAMQDLQQRSCEAGGSMRYVLQPVTLGRSGASGASPAPRSLQARLPATVGACVEDVAACREDAKLRKYLDDYFADGCRDGHPTLSSLWTRWFPEMEQRPKPLLEGYAVFVENLQHNSVPFKDVISWDALYECPAAGCTLLVLTTMQCQSAAQWMWILGQPDGPHFSRDEFLGVADRMQFCYEEMLENPRQQLLLTWLGFIIAAVELSLAKVRGWANELRPRNPHHEEQRLVWHDYYSGLYQAVNYSEQFDLQWKLALEQPDSAYGEESSVRLDNCTLNDMIASTFGQRNYLFCSESALWKHERSEIGISRSNFVTLDLARFEAAKALDVGCGFGRWTMMLQSIGCKVTSVDASPHAVKSTRRFNEDTHQMSLFELPQLENFHEGFDLVVCWGVLHHTHDPYKGFKIVTSALKEGGVLFIQVYNDRAKAGFHYTQSFRARFHELKTEKDKLEFLRQTFRPAGADIFDHLDGMLTFYNWVVHEETVRNWFLTNGFADYWKVWNYKYLGRKRPLLAPVRDDAGILLRNDVGESVEEGRNYPILSA